MTDGIIKIPYVISFDIACQINSSPVARWVSVSFVISYVQLMNAC